MDRNPNSPLKSPIEQLATKAAKIPWPGQHLMCLYFYAPSWKDVKIKCFAVIEEIVVQD